MKYFSKQRNSMKKLCRALFKYENKIKLVDKIMRSHIQKGDVLGWNPSITTFPHVPNHFFVETQDTKQIFVPSLSREYPICY